LGRFQFTFAHGGDWQFSQNQYGSMRSVNPVTKLSTPLIDRRTDDSSTSSTRTVDRPPEALAIAKQYLRRERPLSALVVVLAVVGFLGTVVATSLVPAIVVGDY